MTGEEAPGQISYQVLPVKWAGLANRPSAENEVLRLMDGDDETVCLVNIQEGDGWPECGNPDGASIYLADLSADDLSRGEVWKESRADRAGARHNRPTDVFDGEDTGSPGHVPGLGAADAASGSPSPQGETATGPEADDDAQADDDTIDY